MPEELETAVSHPDPTLLGTIDESDDRSA